MDKANIHQGKSAFDKKPLGERCGNKATIEKKIKNNPKYQDVKSQIDHGKSMKDVQVVSDNLVAKRKGEHFGRIKATTLAKFLNETNNEESVFNLVKEDKENSDTVSVSSHIS